MLAPTTAPWAVAGVPLALAAWSFASVLALNAVLPRGHSRPIPFAEAGFFDGVTCLRCLDAARETGSATSPRTRSRRAPDVGEPREWLVASWFSARHRDTTFETLAPSGAAVELRDDLPARFRLLTRTGTAVTFEGAQQTDARQAIAGALGFGCAVRIGEHWWVVDSATGVLHTTSPRGVDVPSEPWAGVARGPNGELIVAAADQWIGVFDAASGRELDRFAARVWPSLGVTVGECSGVVAGDAWYATFNSASTVLTVYDRQGRFIGERRLDRFLEFLGRRVTSIGASGRWLAVGYGDVVETLELTIGPECTRH